MRVTHENYTFGMEFFRAASGEGNRNRIPFRCVERRVRFSLGMNVLRRFPGMAVSRLFIDPTFHSNKVRKVFEMLEDIREAFVLLVDKTDWMDQQTKVATLEKSRKMTSEIGFPEWLFDDKKLNEYYKGVSLVYNQIRFSVFFSSDRLKSKLINVDFFN